ncbi:hypothetical protein F2P56_029724 [Juglans regia]|uniref:TF-B3 domain-containing protein n=2 Tax=Juglans regia TaxID=51240 RepID=A0A833WWZ0_JUGRE|nr:B3 domain-containing protein Os03g0120900-like [Juglans regia]KAF5449259.1 hypothetical protein F2P56_029724 [Juglans regia]
MAGVEPASVEAVAMLHGATNAENVRLVPNHPGPYHHLGCNSSSAEARRRQYLKRYLRHSMLRERLPQPGREQRTSIRPSPAPEPRHIDQSKLRLLFEKQLRKSDVSSAGRIVIPKLEAEMYLPYLDKREIISINLSDMDYELVWKFNFRAWANNSSRMYVLDNTKNFIREHDLVVGDSIMVFKDCQTGKYLIRAIKKISNIPKVVHPYPTSHNYGYANLRPTVGQYGFRPLHYGTCMHSNMNGYSVNYYSGVQPHNIPQTQPPALLWNHQPFNVTGGTQLQVHDIYLHTTDDIVINANLPVMNDQNGSPLVSGSSSTNNMNENSETCNSTDQIMNPDNSQSPDPFDNIDWEDLAEFLAS